VHGCLAELEELLAVASIGDDDAVIFVGDLIARGPDSPGVLDLVKCINAKSVQGNHERKLLQAYTTERQSGQSMKLAAGHRQLLRVLTPEQWAVIESMPFYLELPQHQACVVHAGVLPGLPMARQDPWVLTHIRSLDPNGRPSPDTSYMRWSQSYRGPTHIVFGHSAQIGIQFAEYATGLDSGCVYGGRLTGLLLEEGKPVPALAERAKALVSVPARRVYYQPRAS